MAVYRTKTFSKFARKNGLVDGTLQTAAQEILDGNPDADLGGGLFKQRVAKQSGGKSSGFRTLITHKTSKHVFFVYGFEKNAKDNIDATETKALKKLAKILGAYSQRELETAVADGALFEIAENDDEDAQE
jgi:hypothetical protein